MDTAAFEQMYEAFWEFRSLFVPLFGRRESRDHRQNCILRQADYILNTLDKVSHCFGNLDTCVWTKGMTILQAVGLPADTAIGSTSDASARRSWTPLATSGIRRAGGLWNGRWHGSQVVHYLSALHRRPIALHHPHARR